MSEINLNEKYSGVIQQRFTEGSLVDGRLSNDIDFVGAKTVIVSTISTVPIVDYDRNASGFRYGTPQEVGDTIQELTMTQDKAFSASIDRGNQSDQSINKVGRFLGIQVSEKMVPLMDAYRLGVLAGSHTVTETITGEDGTETTSTKSVYNAGTVNVSAVALKGSNIISRMALARQAMLDNHVPLKGRTWFVSSAVFNYLCETDQFKNLDKLGNGALVNGQVGELFGAPVVEVPADIMPASVNFMLVHRDSACCPVKLDHTKMHEDPVGFNGWVIEGRFYFDCFVFEAKKYGIYVDRSAA